ncbi:unnamed protein product [Angiostrongylus costaricensis]|uniref:SCP domain-containing protein n=1 Tax=Angiostrongylus costaricensis TaxID=334426 RepID=A0A0R3PBS0_ANGCS|nr:unnamed protein product [Angiostrongylus costaricensis]
MFHGPILVNCCALLLLGLSSGQNTSISPWIAALDDPSTIISCEPWITITPEPWTTTSNGPSTATSSRRTTSSLMKETQLANQNLTARKVCVFRSLVARGRAANAEHPGEFAPSSSRMDLMEYDCVAERYALRHVCLCDRKQSPAAYRPGYQENIHILQTTSTNTLGALQNAISTFTSELTSNGIPSNMAFSANVNQRQHRTVTRVSKVIWGTNRYVGCATQLCRGFYFTSCMYRNPVNVVGSNIYSIGAVCSACPAGPNNCNTAIGLCSW